MSEFAQPLTRAQMAAYMDGLRPTFDDAEVVHRKGDRIVLRCHRSVAENPIILKMWGRSGFKGGLRRLLGMSACNYEWWNMVRLDRFGIAVPQPLGFFPVVPSIAGYTDVLFMEDLGACTTATEHLKGLILAGDELQGLALENALIELTAGILKAGIVDADHGMLNTVVTANGRVVRLDLEIARWVIWPRCFPRQYGRMLGRMIGLHAFAVQPEIERTVHFAERMRARLQPSPRVLRLAYATARRMMQEQLHKAGINTELVLPWC